MKTLRTLIIMVILSIGTMNLTGCINGNNTPNTKEEVKGGNKLEKSNRKGVTLLFDLISWATSIIALLTAVYALIRLNSAHNRISRLRRELGDLNRKLYFLEQKSREGTHAVTSNSRFGSNEYNALENRIYGLELQVCRMNRSSEPENRHVVCDNPIPDLKRENREQIGFFGLPVQMSSIQAYFKGFSANQETDSRFSVKIKDNVAKFKLLEGIKYLNDLKNGDVIKMALDITGCAPSDATRMKVISPGVAHKDGDRWIINKKAKVELSR